MHLRSILILSRFDLDIKEAKGGYRGHSPPPPWDFEAKNVLNLIKKMFNVQMFNHSYHPLFKLYEGITIFIKSSVRENMFF